MGYYLRRSCIEGYLPLFASDALLKSEGRELSNLAASCMLPRYIRTSKKTDVVVAP